MTQFKNDLINSRLQHVVVFPISRSPYLVLCPRQCKWKAATTYLTITTKTIKIFDYENLLLLKPPNNYKKQHRRLRSLRKNKNNNFIIFIRSISR